ncbi:hypothetical protein FQA39_LY03044 [Lamprigera yunnana]|nr:hypothetical protein FQA39_LY03044 [Lamprigera yunnana]
MDKWMGKVAIVTGASSGIGAAVATHLVQAGLKVVGLGRSKDRLEALSKLLNDKKGTFYPFTADILIENDVLTAYNWITENVGPVHILVNSAGIFKPSTLADCHLQTIKEMFDTNVIGLCVATREAIKDMRKNNVAGHIVHINSLAGHVVTKFSDLSIYTASKHTLTALTESLRQELNSIGSKIKVTSISPSFVDTNMIDPFNMKGTPNLTLLTPEDIADSVLYALSTPPNVHVHDILLHLQYYPFDI